MNIAHLDLARVDSLRNVLARLVRPATIQVKGE